MEKASYTVIRLQTNQTDLIGGEDELVNRLRNLCKVFDWGFKIFSSFRDGDSTIFIIDIEYLSESIFKADYWDVLKIFIVHYDLRLINIDTTTLLDR